MEDLYKKIESTLNSADGLQRAEAPGFFHTRVQARLEKRLTQPLQEAWLPVSRPIWVVASLVLLLAANVFLVTAKTDRSMTMHGETIETSSLQGFASSYGLSTSTGY